ncbi:hypothetical protein ACFQ3Z_14515 [Streptomyces nogalater]
MRSTASASSAVTAQRTPKPSASTASRIFRNCSAPAPSARGCSGTATRILLSLIRCPALSRRPPGRHGGKSPARPAGRAGGGDGRAPGWRTSPPPR